MNIRDIETIENRTKTALIIHAGMNTVDDILTLNSTQLRNIRGLGRKGFNDIIEYLHEANLILQPDKEPIITEHCNFCHYHKRNTHKVGLWHICETCAKELKEIF